MLTQQEKDWLERRKNLCSRCEFCLYDNPCVRYGTKGKSGRCEGFWPRNMDGDRPKPCAFIHFEGFSEGTKMCGRYDPRHGCRPCELRWAMLRAEQSMEEEHA